MRTTMKHKDKRKLIKRCQEKDRQGWTYVQGITKKVLHGYETIYYVVMEK